MIKVVKMKTMLVFHQVHEKKLSKLMSQMLRFYVFFVRYTNEILPQRVMLSTIESNVYHTVYIVK